MTVEFDGITFITDENKVTMIVIDGFRINVTQTLPDDPFAGRADALIPFEYEILDGVPVRTSAEHKDLERTMTVAQGFRPLFTEIFKGFVYSLVEGSMVQMRKIRPDLFVQIDEIRDSVVTALASTAKDALKIDPALIESVLGESINEIIELFWNKLSSEFEIKGV